MSKSVLVLMGGISVEREVSLTSGKACAEALIEAGYDVKTYDFNGDVSALVKALGERPDVVYNSLHGRWAEDGCVQGLLELMHIPYSHSGVMASALAMNKVKAKEIVSSAGITSPHGKVVTRAELLEGDPLPRPYVIKPISEGSSVGVRIVRDDDNEPAAGCNPEEPDEEVLVETFIEGRELTVAVMDDRALEVTELRPRVRFYDYEAKYTEGVTEHLLPAPIHPSIREAALDAALKAHRALGCRGVSRSDFRYDDTKGEPGQLYYLETNTQPGMTALSLVPEQAALHGIPFPELCAWMVENATCDS